MEKLSDLTDSSLTDRLYTLRKEERGLLVEYLLHLGEVDARLLHQKLGYSSLFAFCTDRLRLSNASAFRRMTAARMLRQHPLIAEYLADDRLCLTTLVELRDVVNGERLREILDRAAGRNQDEVRTIAASYAPRPAPPDLIRRHPERRRPTTSATEAPPPETVLDPPAKTAPPTASPARIEPIGEHLHIIRMTVTQAFIDDLKEVRFALSHKFPDGKLESLFHDCMLRTLTQLHRRRVGSGSRRPMKTPPKGRTIPVDIERAVWQRDESKCAFVGSDGHRCGSTHRLELHHIVPFAMGGGSTVENLSVRCKAHNQYQAIQDFGAEHMVRAVANG